MEYGCATPCDCFRLTCPWECADDGVLAQAVRFLAEHNGQRVFTGVVDECEVSWSGAGSKLEVSGRGLAGLLLDNEAEGLDYEVATLDNILRDHVTPYGIQVAKRGNFPAVEHFSVASGSSEWSVLYQFAQYYGGISPRFDRQGRLILTGWEDDTPRVLDDRTPITALSARDRRYGVISEVWVRERSAQAVTEKVKNTAFLASGGQCRRMFTMPGKSSYQAMRYRGQYQLDKSAAGLLTVRAEIALPFCAWPGELVELRRDRWGRCGTFRVAQSKVVMDAKGYRTVLELVAPGAVL